MLKLLNQILTHVADLLLQLWLCTLGKVDHFMRIFLQIKHILSPVH